MPDRAGVSLVEAVEGYGPDSDTGAPAAWCENRICDAVLMKLELMAAFATPNSKCERCRR